MPPPAMTLARYPPGVKHMRPLHGSGVWRRGVDGKGGCSRSRPWTVTVPFKANQDRRHHIPKQRHRVTNWAAYDIALRQRGSLTVWFTDALLHGSTAGRSQPLAATFT